MEEWLVGVKKHTMWALLDVIVVCGGDSRLGTAASCAEHDLSVALLKRQPRLESTTGIAVGSLTANRTRWQQRIGIHDRLEDRNCDASWRLDGHYLASQSANCP